MKASQGIGARVARAAHRVSLCAGAALLMAAPDCGGACMPTAGAVHNLVILCQFPDHADGCFHLERRKNYGDGEDYFGGDTARSVIGPGPAEYPKAVPFLPTTDAYRNGVVRRTPNQISHISAPGAEVRFTYEAPSDPGDRKSGGEASSN